MLAADQEKAWAALPASSQLESAVRDSLATVRNLLTEGAEREEIALLARQVERLLSVQDDRLHAINRDLEAFNNSVTHDLCAPLARICALTRALGQRYAGRLDSDILDYLERIFNSSRHMSELIEALLELSRFSYLNLKREMVDLSEIAGETAGELRQGTPERRAQFLIEPHIRTFGDARLLEIAMTNLLRNAWKFTRMREATCIEFGTCELSADRTCFVRDNGIGFDMSHADRLFQPFQRLHNSAEYPGYGIGLTTVQRIINRHGGRIWAEGAVDQGATFYFTLKQCIG